MEHKHQRNKHNQTGANDFQHLIWIFWVCQLSPSWYNADCFQLMSQCDHYQVQLVYSITEHHTVRNLQHKTSQNTFDTLDQSQHLSSYTAQIVFVFQGVFNLFFVIINHNWWKCCFLLSIFNNKMATQKFTSFDEFFFKCMLMCQLIQTNKIVSNEVKDN